MLQVLDMLVAHGIKGPVLLIATTKCIKPEFANMRQCGNSQLQTHAISCAEASTGWVAVNRTARKEQRHLRSGKAAGACHWTAA
eukprot:5367957-Amphidinium_carterae.1